MQKEVRIKPFLDPAGHRDIGLHYADDRTGLHRLLRFVQTKRAVTSDGGPARRDGGDRETRPLPASENDIGERAIYARDGEADEVNAAEISDLNHPELRVKRERQETGRDAERPQQPKEFARHESDRQQQREREARGAIPPAKRRAAGDDDPGMQDRQGEHRHPVVSREEEVPKKPKQRGSDPDDGERRQTLFCAAEREGERGEGNEKERCPRVGNKNDEIQRRIQRTQTADRSPGIRGGR